MKAVIFDLGGVVFDWDPHTIIATFLDTLSLPADEQLARTALLKEEVFDHPDWLETDRGFLNEANATKQFAARTGHSMEEMEQLQRVINASLVPFPETLQLIEDLTQRGVPLYVLSNMPAERGAYLLKTFDFWDKFAGIILSGNVRLIKPDAAIYQHLLAEFGLQAEDCAFLDDSVENVIAASAVGIYGIHFKSAAQCRPLLEAWLDS